MKKFLLIMMVSFCAEVYAQGLAVTERFKEVKDNSFMEQLVVNPTLPDVAVTGYDMKTSTLLKFIDKNRKFKNKPLLLMTTYTFCGGCHNIFLKLADGGLTDRYDVVLVVEKTGTDNEAEKIAAYMKREKVVALSKQYNVVFVLQNEFGPLYNSSATPMFLFADDRLRPYYSFTSLDTDTVLKQVPEILKLGEMQLAKRGKVWLDQNMFPVPPDSGQALYYYSIEEKGGRGKMTMGHKNYLQRSDNYIITDKQLVRDGKMIINNLTAGEDGTIKQSPYSEVTYKMGVPTHAYKSWHANGKVAEDNPLNGVYRSYDEAGVRTAEGPVKNGLGEGLFEYYSDNVLTGSKLYKAGKAAE